MRTGTPASARVTAVLRPVTPAPMTRTGSVVAIFGTLAAMPAAHGPLRRARADGGRHPVDGGAGAVLERCGVGGGARRIARGGLSREIADFAC
ncbi:hypothetical protein GCM10027271_18540 [Saccharopolyspora gloriosae]